MTPVRASPVMGCSSGSLQTSLQTSVRRLAVRFQISLRRIEDLLGRKGHVLHRTWNYIHKTRGLVGVASCTLYSNHNTTVTETTGNTNCTCVSTFISSQTAYGSIHAGNGTSIHHREEVRSSAGLCSGPLPFSYFMDKVLRSDATLEEACTRLRHW